MKTGTSQSIHNAEYGSDDHYYCIWNEETKRKILTHESEDIELNKPCLAVTDRHPADGRFRLILMALFKLVNERVSFIGLKMLLSTEI